MVDSARLSLRSRLVLVGLVAVAIALVSLPGQAQTADDVAVERLEGEDRIATSVAISADTFAAGSVDEVVLARADDYADGLAGATLATASDAPILLTYPDMISDGVLAEIDRLGADGVTLLGGTTAISADVASTLEGEGLAVSRIAGEDRFETAIEIAGELGAEASTVFIAEGRDPDPHRGWPDALAVAPYASFHGAPILLVETDRVPDGVVDALDELGTETVTIVGGPAAVSDEVAGELEAEGRSVARIAGEDRYETAGAIYDEALADGMNPAERWLATGRNFPDALAAAPSVVAAGGALQLIDGEGLARSPQVIERSTAAFELLERIVLLGGEAAIDADAEGEVVAALEQDLGEAAFCLTVLHNNDGESQLIDAGSGLEDYGGVARFVTLANQEQEAALEGTEGDGCAEYGEITVSSGDNWLPGPEITASQEAGTIYDAIALDAVGYDALAIGNHDFDLGPDFTAEFISAFESDATFLSANLDFSAEAELQALVDSGDIAPSTTVETGGRTVGIIGATTPLLASISSPGNVTVDDDVAGIVQAEVDALRSEEGADVVVLISHLQDVAEDVELIGELAGVDVVVAGGGDEVLGDHGDLYLPGHPANISGPYPDSVADADGDSVPVVTTPGSYGYLGRLQVRFDADGDLTGVDERRSRMLRVADETLPGGVAADADVQADVVDPVAAFIDALDEEVVGETNVELDGSRPAIRLEETNLGNLIADAFRTAAVDRSADIDAVDESLPFVTIQNGGGIRNDSVIPPGEITVADTFNISPFGNIVSVQEVGAERLKLLLENGYSQLPSDDGRFAHVAGMEVVVDTSQPAQVPGEGNAVETEGERVQSVELADGTIVVEDGAVVDPDMRINVAAVNFIMSGGDQYPFAEDFTQLGLTDQAALAEYIEVGLSGQITSTDYPAGGEGRITIE